MDFSNDMPSVPPSETDVLLWAKSAAAINMNKSNISRLIPVPAILFTPSFKNAIVLRA
jgi:hypothetical protein